MALAFTNNLNGFNQFSFRGMSRKLKIKHKRKKIPLLVFRWENTRLNCSFPSTRLV